MPGTALCIANLAITKKRMEGAGRKGVQEWAKKVMDVSTTVYCPVDKGLLKSTGKTKIHKNTLTEFHVRLSYSTPYAVYVHEIPTYYHPHGQWKFLSTPFNKMSPLLIKMLETEMQNAI